MSSKHSLFVVFSLALLAGSALSESDDGDLQGAQTASTFQIEGKLSPPDPKPKDWYWATQILVDGGYKQGYLKVIKHIIYANEQAHDAFNCRRTTRLSSRACRQVRTWSRSPILTSTMNLFVWTSIPREK